jgi:hypothetical protein
LIRQGLFHIMNASARFALRPLHTLLAFSALAFAAPSQAGRPMSVDDASVNPFAQCQLETWVDQTNDEHSLVLAPACGLGSGVEVGVELNTPRRASRKDAERSASIKWVPEDGKWMDWDFGAKLSIAQVRAAGTSGWESGGTTLLGIASHSFDKEWMVHLNLGAAFDSGNSDTLATGGVALMWTPHKNWVVFGELSGTQDESVTRAAGARFWLMPEVLGMDLTASHINGHRDSTAYTLGVSYYGIKF